jgi:hypothetical protein
VRLNTLRIALHLKRILPGKMPCMHVRRAGDLYTGRSAGGIDAIAMLDELQ